MNLTTKAKVLVVILAIAILGLVCYFSYQVFFNPPPPSESVPPSVQLRESRLIGRQDGERQWEIFTNSVLQVDRQVILTEMDKITLFQDEEPYFFVDAEKAVWDRQKNSLELYDAVITQVDDELRLESELLILNEKQSTLKSPGRATINWQGLKILSEEMILEMEEGLLHLKEGVEIRDGKFYWKMQEAVYNFDSSIMDFFGVVILETEVGGNE